jgi:hypothetical protein
MRSTPPPTADNSKTIIGTDGTSAIIDPVKPTTTKMTAIAAAPSDVYAGLSRISSSKRQQSPLGRRSSFHPEPPESGLDAATRD